MSATEPVKMTFERCADTTLAEVRATYAQRGEDYSDSWSLETFVTTFTAHTLRELAGIEMTPEELRLVICAALVDIKDSRMIGKWRRDSLIDGCAYRALYAQLRADLDSHVHIKEAPP